MNDHEKLSTKIKGVRASFDRIGEGLEDIKRRLQWNKKNLFQPPQNESKVDSNFCSGDGPKLQLNLTPPISVAATQKTEFSGVVAIKQTKTSMRRIRYQLSKPTFQKAQALYNTSKAPVKGILKNAAASTCESPKMKTVTWSFIKPVDEISSKTKAILSKVFQPNCPLVEIKSGKVISAPAKGGVVQKKRALRKLEDIKREYSELYSLCDRLKRKLGNKKSPALGKLLPQFKDSEMMPKAAEDCVLSKALELGNSPITAQKDSDTTVVPIFKKGYVSQMAKQFGQATSVNRIPQKIFFVDGAPSVAKLVDVFSTITLL